MASGNTKSKGYLEASVKVGDVAINCRAVVLSDIHHDGIIGRDFLRKTDFAITKQGLFFNGKKVEGANESDQDDQTDSAKLQEVTVWKWATGQIVNELEWIGTEDQNKENPTEFVEKCWVRFPHVFADTMVPSKVILDEVVPLKAESKPVFCALYRRSILDQERIDLKVEEMLKKRIIEPSSSRWSSNLVLVSKKDSEEKRFCVDYRKLNSCTEVMEYSIPRIDNCLDEVIGNSVFSKIDLASGYHQFVLAESDRDKTSFSTRKGQWRYRVLPFGLVNAPFVFQRKISEILRPFIGNFVTNYLDDLLVHSKSRAEHKQHLVKIFQILESNHLTINQKKSVFFQSEVNFLGHQVSKSGVRMTEDYRLKAVNFKEPGSFKELRMFLGFTSFSRRFVDNYAKKACPLYDILRMDRFKWGQEAQKAFEQLKEDVKAGVLLSTPDFQKKFILEVDANLDTVGAVLKQGNDVIGFASKRFSGAFLNYTITEKECKAIVFGIKYFEHYLFKEFVVKSDHAALQWLNSMKNPSGMFARWLVYLQKFRFKIVHLKGKENVLADTLTRLEVKELEVSSDQEAREVIGLIHEELGHGGVEATYTMAMGKINCPTLYAKVKEYISKCDSCVRNRRNNTKFLGFGNENL